MSFERIQVYEVLVVMTGKDVYDVIGIFETREQAELTAQQFSPRRNKIIEKFAFRSLSDPREVYLCEAPLILATDLQDLKRRTALAKLTPEERELLKL